MNNEEGRLFPNSLGKSKITDRRLTLGCSCWVQVFQQDNVPKHTSEAVKEWIYQARGQQNLVELHRFGHSFRRPIKPNECFCDKVVCVPLTPITETWELELKTVMMYMFFMSGWKLLTVFGQNSMKTNWRQRKYLDDLRRGSERTVNFTNRICLKEGHAFTYLQNMSQKSYSCLFLPFTFSCYGSGLCRLTADDISLPSVLFTFV